LIDQTFSGEGWISAAVVNSHLVAGLFPLSNDLALAFLDNSGLCWIVSILHSWVIVGACRSYASNRRIGPVLLRPISRRCLTLSTTSLCRWWCGPVAGSKL